MLFLSRYPYILLFICILLGISLQSVLHCSILQLSVLVSHPVQRFSSKIFVIGVPADCTRDRRCCAVMYEEVSVYRTACKAVWLQLL